MLDNTFIHTSIAMQTSQICELKLNKDEIRLIKFWNKKSIFESQLYLDTICIDFNNFLSLKTEKLSLTLFIKMHGCNLQEIIMVGVVLWDDHLLWECDLKITGLIKTDPRLWISNTLSDLQAFLFSVEINVLLKL